MLTAFFILFQLGFSAHAELPAPPKDGRFTLGADVTYFNTDANYSSGGGSYDSIPSKLTSFLYGFNGGYELGREWRLSGALNISSVVAEADPEPLSNSGLRDLSLSVQYWWRYARFHIVPQGDLVFPIYKVDKNGTDPLIGEGAMTLTGGAWWMWRHRPWTPFVYLGFTYRDGGRSHLVPYSAGVYVYTQPNSWWVQGELRGYRSITDDADTANRDERNLYLDNANGGSHIYYSINPSLMELAASGGVHLVKQWNLYAGVAQSIDGASTARGMTFTAGLQFGSRPAGRASISAPVDEGDQFSVPTPEYDESLFQENSVVPEKKAPVRRAPVKKKKPKVNVDQMIQDTEKSLERRK